MLSSDCLQSKKEKLCLHGKKEMSNTWNLQLSMALIMEQCERCHCIMAASYSLIQLIQSLGRIRPTRQNHDFTSYDPSRSGDFWQQLNDIKARHMCQTAQVIQPWKSSIEICSIYKVIKTSFVAVIYVTTDIVHTLWNHKLRKNHAMSDAAIQARAPDSIKKDYVHEQLTKMKERCAVCKSSTFDRTVAACLKNDSRHYCYSCHAYSCGDNYHKIA